MKTILMILGLAVTIPVLAESCQLEVLKKNDCGIYHDYSTTVTTTEVIREGGKVIVKEQRGYETYPYCNYSASLGLNVAGYIEYESDDLHSFFEEAGRLLENGSCKSFKPQKCEAIRATDSQIYVMVNNEAFVPVWKGSPAESLLEARKLVSLLSIRNLCK